jgi:hypothetical protein
MCNGANQTTMKKKKKKIGGVLGQEFIWWKKIDLQYLWKPKFSSSAQTFLSKFMQTPQYAYFNGLRPCPQGEFVQGPLHPSVKHP